MRVVSVITARGGSKSIYKKNIININNSPLIGYPIKASLKSPLVNETFVDTDCDQIAKISEHLGAKILLRPKYLAGDDVDHGDVIRYSCNKVLKMGDVDIFVVLLGNTVMINSELIDKSINILSQNSEATAVCSVWKAADDHPMRAMEIKDGYLQSHSSVIRENEITTDRSSYSNAYYYDQGVWTFKSSNINSSKEGPSTWNWLGNKVIPIEREWITGRDINGPFDVNFHKYWTLINKKQDDYEIFNELDN